MGSDLETLLSRYDAGRMSRRDLLGALTALLVAPPAPEVGVAKQLNHVTVFVPNVERSHAFYRDLLGMAVLTKQEPGVNLRAGGGFLGLYPAEQGSKARIDHFCLGLEKFDADATRAKLAAQGLEAIVRLRGDTKELYFTDPDGLRVQLQDVRYRGGVGPLGDRDP
jgi:glyoxylase I family protein